MFKVLINSPRKPWSQSCRRKGRLQCKGFAEKEGFKPGMKECGLIVIMVASAFHTDVFVNKAKSIDISQVFRGKAGVFVMF